MSFTNVSSLSVTGNTRFVGLDNYIYLFTRDRNFIQALLNTLKLLAVVPIVLVFFSLVFAFLLTQIKLLEKGLYRVLFFIPSIISMTVIAVVWSIMFDPRAAGVINQIIGVFGIAPVAWLGDPRFALWCIALVMIWQGTGYYMVMLVAAIDGISADIYEAADIDGANAINKFFRITVPILKDSIGIVYVLALSGTIGASYILSRIMTNGGPGNSSLVLLQHMYNTAFGPSANFGYAMTITVVSLVLALVLSVLSRKVSYQNDNV
jgi:N-acetylglucosamine transport system permease protein